MAIVARHANSSSALLWMVEFAGAVHGPFTRNELLKLILSKQLNAQAKLKLNVWNEFRPILDCLDLLATNNPKGTDIQDGMERRIAAPRTNIAGLVTIYKETAEIEALGSNISATGIFLKTGETIFRIGDQVAINASINEFSKPFTAHAEIMRYSSNLKHGVGYGLRFTQIDNITVEEISRIVGVRPITEFGELHSSPKTKPSKKV